MSLPPFQWLLDEHASGLRRFLVGYVGWAEADDCLQDTLLAASEAYPGLRHGSNLRGWLFTIARRKALDCLRRRARDAVLGLALDSIGIEAAGIRLRPGIATFVAGGMRKMRFHGHLC